jgi:hypothetical protein
VTAAAVPSAEATAQPPEAGHRSPAEAGHRSVTGYPCYAIRTLCGFLRDFLVIAYSFVRVRILVCR